MSDITSRPFHPKMACERCAFGRGPHADWCNADEVRRELQEAEESADTFDAVPV